MIHKSRAAAEQYYRDVLFDAELEEDITFPKSSSHKT